MPFKIRTKLIVAFLAMLIPLVVIVCINRYNDKAIYLAAHKVEELHREISSLSDLQIALDMLIMPANDYLITGDIREREEFHRLTTVIEGGLRDLSDGMRCRKCHEVTDKMLKRFYGQVPKTFWSEEMVFVKEVKERLQVIKEKGEEIFKIERPVGSKEGAALMQEIDAIVHRLIREAILKHREKDEKELSSAIKDSEKVWKRSWLIMTGGFVLSVAVGLSFAFFYAGFFVRPIEAIHNGADAIAAGNFKTQLDIKTGDEIQQLANAMNEMAAQLDSFTSNLQGMVEERTAELRESEERYRGIFEKTPNAMVIFDAETWRFENVNRAAIDLYGYTDEEFLSLTPADVSAEVEKTRKAIQNGLAKKYAHIPVRYHKKKDGTVFPIEIFMGTFLSNGRPKGFAVMVDLTEIKKAEETLRYERDKLIKIFEAMEDGVYIVDQNYDIEYINPSLEKGYGPWKGIKCYTYFHDRTEICPWCPNKRVWAGETVRWEWYSFKNNKTYDLLDTPLRNPDGSVWKLEIFRDITDKKKAEKELQESEERYRVLGMTAPNAIICLKAPDTITFWNRRAGEIFGYSEEEAVGKSMHDLIVPERYREKAGEGLKNFFQSGTGPVVGKKTELSALRRDGTEFPIELSVSAMNIGGNWQATGIVRDITERKKAEEALRHERDMAQTYLNIAGVMFLVIDSNEKVSLVNKKGAEVLGYPEGEIIGKNWFDEFLPERVRDEIRSVFRKLMSGEDGSFEYVENPVLTRSGEERLIAWHNTVLKDDAGKIIATLSSGEDITERKKAEKALKESETRLKGLVESVTDYVFTVEVKDGQPMKTTHGPGCVAITGYTFEEYEANPNLWLQMVYEGDRDAVVSQAEAVLSRKAEPIEHRVICKDGRIKWVRNVPVPRYDENGRLISYDGLISDITERKEAEEAVLQRIKELEEFRKVTIKRELRMEELQRKVEEMEKKLGIKV